MSCVWCCHILRLFDALMQVHFVQKGLLQAVETVCDGIIYFGIAVTNQDHHWLADCLDVCLHDPSLSILLGSQGSPYPSRMCVQKNSPLSLTNNLGDGLVMMQVQNFNRQVHCLRQQLCGPQCADRSSLQCLAYRWLEKLSANSMFWVWGLTPASRWLPQLLAGTVCAGGQGRAGASWLAGLL